MFDWLIAWIMSLDASLRPAVITGGATLIAALFGFTAVFIQIGRQARNAIKQNKLNEALKLKVQIYEETLKVSRKAQDAVSDFTSYLRNFSTTLSFIREAIQVGINWQQPAARFPEYLRLRGEATSAIIAVMTMIEGWQIVEPKLDLFSRAIAMGHSRLLEIDMKAPNVFIPGMPAEGFLAMWRPPDDELASAIRQRVTDELYNIERLAAWVHDFQVEMQLLLLGDLFSNDVKRRNPPDPEQFCIRLDHYDEIAERLDNSDWGRKAAEMEAEAWDRFTQGNEAKSSG